MLSTRFIPVVLKQVVRHRTRSLLTIAGVAVAMFLFCAVQALQRGAAQATRATAEDTRLVVYRKDRYCPYTSRLPQHYEERIARVPGVAGVVPVRLVVSNCRTSLNVITFRGVPAEAFRTRLAPRLGVPPAALAEWLRRDDAVLVGRDLAQRRRLAVGDRFVNAGVPVYVAGFVESDAPQDRNVAYAHLDFVQRAAGRGDVGTVTQFTVHVQAAGQLEDVARAIDREFAHDPEPTQTRSEQAFLTAAAGDVLEIIAFTRWLGWGCVVAVLALVGNAILLSAQDRIREHAVLQTLGYPGQLVARLILTETLLLSLAGGAVGAAAAYGALRAGRFALSIEGLSIPAYAGAAVVGWGLLLAVGVGVLAGLAPAWQAARRDIVTCFRAV